MFNARRLAGYFIGFNVLRANRYLLLVCGIREYFIRRFWPFSSSVRGRELVEHAFMRSGYTFLEFSCEQKEKLIRCCEEKIEVVGLDQAVPTNGTDFLLDILNPVDYDPGSPFMQFALNESILNEVGKYLGIAPLINSIELIYSSPTDKAGVNIAKTQLFHRDYIGKKVVKLFFYVRDVADCNGPLIFIPLHESRKIPWWKQVPHYIEDKVIFKYADQREVVKFHGPKGTAALVDTARLFHCGSRCNSGRLAFIVNYTTGFNYKRRNLSPYWTPARISSLELTRLQRLALGQTR